jgi:thiol-disulfide isomerase/thioredoxin
MKTAALYVLLLLAALATAGCSTYQEAPPFRLPDLSGNEVTLEQYRGKIVMLDFWATWCGPCSLSMPILEELQREYPDDLSLLAINMEEPRDKVRRYVAERKLRSRVLLDQEGRVSQIYKAWQIPMQVLIDRNGLMRHIERGVNSETAERLRAEIDKLR